MKNSIHPNWRAVLLPTSANLRDAIQNLSQTGMQICLMVGGNQEFIGTITDGDIRRALLRGLSIEDSVETIVNRDSMVANIDMDIDLAINLMLTNRIGALPIIDKNRIVVGLHLLSQYMGAGEVLSNTMVIMAGGLGSRMKPLTNDCPKPLLRVAGKPMLEHIIEKARRNGFRKFIISIGYLGEMIENYFQDGYRFGVEISYIKENQPLGTAGALGLLDPSPSEALVVANGDVISDVSYDQILEFHISTGADATMAVRLYEWQHPFGVVQTNGLEIIGFQEKPISKTQINAGIYVINPQAIGLLKKNESCDMPTLFNRIRQNEGKTVAYALHENWSDIGNIAEFTKHNEAR